MIRGYWYGVEANFYICLKVLNVKFIFRVFAVSANKNIAEKIRLFQQQQLYVINMAKFKLNLLLALHGIAILVMSCYC